ncbi:protocadherin Fat 1-like [Mercenaria mercenaria]|uniref:protocadherin Fat 1-like n=1 Tax=Mercenaria mercenaria TaxID=6596 RepID=UPI00234EBE30|nr:protocadherin Fat 1-like [Mercenaria mercenaria]
MNFINDVRGFLVLAAFIGCSQSAGPLVSDSSCGPYSTINEDFPLFGAVCRFHVTDIDANDRIKVIPDDDTTAQYFNIVLEGSGNNVWVNVTLKKPLDRETLGGMVTMQISIIDTQHNQLHYEHTIYIIDVNDEPPEFQNLSSYMLEINELPCNKTVVYTNIHATDKDSGANGRIRYAMTPKVQSLEARQMYSQTFSIDPVTGHVSLNSCLDYERNSYYQFRVTAQDAGSNIQFTSTTELVILVKDVIDESAFITG